MPPEPLHLGEGLLEGVSEEGLVEGAEDELLLDEVLPDVGSIDEDLAQRLAEDLLSGEEEESSVDEGGEVSGTEPVIDVDDGDPGGTAV